MTESVATTMQKDLRETTLVKGEVVLTANSRGLALRALDYHCPPVHLRCAELGRIGIEVLRLGRGRLQPSAAKAWRQGGSRWEPRGSLPEGLVLDGYVVARVRGGVDVFVTSYRAEELLVPPSELRRIGLAVGSAPTKATSASRVMAATPR